MLVMPSFNIIIFMCTGWIDSLFTRYIGCESVLLDVTRKLSSYFLVVYRIVSLVGCYGSSHYVVAIVVSLLYRLTAKRHSRTVIEIYSVANNSLIY